MVLNFRVVGRLRYGGVVGLGINCYGSPTLRPRVPIRRVYAEVTP
jgi:hypothetical protein